MSVQPDASRFEMPSTSGRNACAVEVEQASGRTTLRARYSWAVYWPDLVDPEGNEVMLPPMVADRGGLVALLEEVRRYGLTMGRGAHPPASVAVDVCPTPGHSLCFEIYPKDPELLVPKWRAVFVVVLKTSYSFEFRAKYVVDATCLDLFAEGLAAVLGSDAE